MNKLLFNARIIDPFGETEYIENGYILIENETISEVGTGSAPDFKADKSIDLSGKTVIPGMINAHTHLYSALALGMPPPLKTPNNFVEKLEEVWWKLDLALDEQSTQASFEAGLIECLKCGVTTVFDHHSSPGFTENSLDLLVKTAEKLKQNISIAFEITDRNSVELFNGGLAENIRAFKKYQNNKYVYPLIGLHASFTLSDQSLQSIYNALKEYQKWGIHIHVSEDHADEKDAKSKGYKSVIERLHKFKLLNENSFIIHGIHISQSDVELLKKVGATLVHNPTSNANNRVGILSNKHISRLNTGIGTDGMQANMLEEAKQGTLIRSSHLAGSAKSINYLELLFKNNPEIATRAFGRKIGHLAPGNQADLAIYDYHPRTAINATNYAGHLLFGISAPIDVITRGEFRMSNTKFINISEQDIINNSIVQSKRLWRTILQ